jgi:divalent metal cation (Fe/Co/Zn/Cd) transporter
MDVHVQVAPDLSVRTGHDIATAVEEAVQRAVPEVSDVIVHIEPEE